MTLAGRPAFKKRLCRTILAVATCLLMVVAPARDASADVGADLEKLPAPLRQYAIKAAFLFNFARYTEWPSSSFQGSLAPIRLCILGSDPFGRALDSVNGKKIEDQNRHIMVIHLVWAEDAPQCHMVFVASSVQGHQEALFDMLQGQPVLTVSDVASDVRIGGVIGLKMVDKKVRFLVNLDNANTAGLKLSSRILALAEIVRNDPSAGVPDRQSSEISPN